jgi:hypothetical protein
LEILRKQICLHTLQDLQTDRTVLAQRKTGENIPERIRKRSGTLRRTEKIYHLLQHQTPISHLIINILQKFMEKVCAFDCKIIKMLYFYHQKKSKKH